MRHRCRSLILSDNRLACNYKSPTHGISPVPHVTPAHPILWMSSKRYLTACIPPSAVT